MWRACVFFVIVFAYPSRGDEFDDLRLKWFSLITGGEAVDHSIPQVRDRLASIESAARSNWSSLQKTPGRNALWTDLASTTTSSQITSSWSRLRAMALAWVTPGQPLFGDATLLTDIRSAMNWLEVNRDSARVPKEYDNWWDWEIGTPLQVNDLLVLLYGQLTPSEIGKYAAAVDRFVADPRIMITSTVSTGANRVWKCQGAALSAIVVKDAAKLQLASDALIPVFAYVTSGDGFYEDGSFIQHGRHPYTGGYGNSLVVNLADLLYLLAGSSWDVRDPSRANLYRWVFESFQPVIYRRAMMDRVRGREVSRSGSPDHATGHSSAAGILRVSQFAPPELAMRMKSMLKEWCLSDSSRDWSSGRSLDQIMNIHRLLADNSIPRRGELAGSWVFAGMDRAVHLRPGWGFGIAMHSSRIYNFESINSENLHGWHSGDGMTYLYTDDLAQFSNSFWPTVDPQRLPGTTVIAGSTARQSQAGGSNVAGGAVLEGSAAVMFELRPDGRQLSARKSWFLCHNKVIALGSGISSAVAGTPVETVVENRLIMGDPAFTVADDGSWAHLETGLGYYFSNGSGWQWSRGDRQGSWKDINTGGSSSTLTRRYQTIWFDHGSAPAAASYSYALLPGKSREEMATYSGRPDFRIVENSADAHAVAEPTLGLRAASFWTNSPKSAAGITTDKIASILVVKAGVTLKIAIADPTQANPGVIHVTLDSAVASVIQKDDTVSVDELSPALRLTINGNRARGRTHCADLRLRPERPVRRRP